MKMSKRMLACFVALLLFVVSPITSYATETAPASTVIQMSDGGYFDPTFFAATYPDLVAQIGTDTNAMYQHYLKYGQCQGMKPFADGAAQSITYQPGSIVVPASTKTHPEAVHTLAYTDSNVDIYYTALGDGSAVNKSYGIALCLYVVNKTSGEVGMYANGVAINGQMRGEIFYSTTLAGTSAEENLITDFPVSEFNNISTAQVSLKYRAKAVSNSYQTASFNLIFYH